MTTEEKSSGKTVLVTGAAGFIGIAVVRHFLEQGYLVKAFVHHSNPFAPHPNVQIVHGSVTDPLVMERAVTGTDIVVHLAARKSDEADSMTVNEGGALILVHAAEKAGVRRIMNISTQSVRLPRKGLYARSKTAADHVMERSTVPVTTLRLSLVYGDAPEGIIGMLLSFAKLPIVPVIGSGRAVFCPIHRDDVALAIERLATSAATAGKTYDAGGPDDWTFDDLLHECGRRIGKKRLRLLHIPVPIALVIAKAIRWMPRPPVTVSNVLGADAVLSMDTEEFFRDIGFRPRPFSEGLSHILGTKKLSSGEDEATSLLRYVLSAPGFPDEETVRRYERALAVHEIPIHCIDGRVHGSRLLLGSLDAVTRFRYPHCLLRQKLLIAAAIAETTTQGAVLLPRRMSVTSVFLVCLTASAAAGMKIALGCCLLLRPSFLRRNAGC